MKSKNYEIIRKSICPGLHELQSSGGQEQPNVILLRSDQINDEPSFFQERMIVQIEQTSLWDSRQPRQVDKIQRYTAFCRKNPATRQGRRELEQAIVGILLQK